MRALNSFLTIAILIASQAAIGQSNTVKKSLVDTVARKEVVSIGIIGDSHKVVVIYADKSEDTLTEGEVNKRGIIHNGGYGNFKMVQAPTGGNTVRLKSGTQPVYVLDGREITEEEMKTVDPKTIESINVLKGKTAIDKYGVKGRNGVVEITSKSPFKTKDDEVVFEKIEIEPSIDAKKWQKFLEIYLTPIQKEASAKIPDGTYKVNVKFWVEKDGTLSDAVIQSDPGYHLGEKVLNILKHSPQWKPGEQNGKLIRSNTTKTILLVISKDQ